jgi:hypothetical protein
MPEKLLSRTDPGDSDPQTEAQFAGGQGGVRNRVEIAAWAWAAGLIQPAAD